MCSIMRYSKAILPCSWAIPKFMSITVFFLKEFCKVMITTSISFLVLSQSNELSNTCILEFLYFFYSIYFRKLTLLWIIEVQIVRILSSRGS